MIGLKEYQEIAVNELKDKINELLDFSESKVLAIILYSTLKSLIIWINQFRN
jgi:hypothetical protein